MNLTPFWKLDTCRFAVGHFYNYILNWNLNKSKQYELELNLYRGCPGSEHLLLNRRACGRISPLWEGSPLPLAALPAPVLSKACLEGTSEVM